MRISLAIPALCLLASQLYMQAQKIQPPSPAANYGNLPLSFEANQGQTDSQVRFLSRGQGYSLFLTDSGAVLALTQHQANLSKPGQPPTLSTRKADVVRMELAGAAPGLRVEGAKQLPGIANYFVGKDSSKWHSNIPTYAQVRYSGVYPGVDLVYYGNQRQLEYDFIVAPGADPKPVKLHFAGARKLKLSPEGDLIITAQNGEIAFHKPVAYQMQNGQRQQVDGRFTLLAKNNAGFSLGSYDHSQELVIDPILAYSTYFGGLPDGSELPGTLDTVVGMAADNAGNVILAGNTISTTFPTSTGAFQRAKEESTAFVSKLNAAGSAMIFSTYLGADAVCPFSGTFASGMALDSTANVYVAGTTACTGFPTTANAYQRTYAGTFKVGFVSKLNSTGTALLASTYLAPATHSDAITGIAVDGLGDPYVVGTTISNTFPTTNGAFQQTDPLGIVYTASFLTKFNTSLSALGYSTYLSGTTNGNTEINAISVDSAGHAFVTGIGGTSLPMTPGDLQSNEGPVFITKFNLAGSGFIYFARLGGPYLGSVNAIATDPAGNAYVTGTTGYDFPTTSGAFQPFELDQGGYSYVAKINPEATALVYATYLTGSAYQAYATMQPLSIAVDAVGDAFVAGWTTYANLPVTPDALQSTNISTPIPNVGAMTGYMGALNPSGSALLYLTYLGGSATDWVEKVVLDSLGNANVAGEAGSSNIPVSPGAFQTQPHDLFVTKFAFNGATTTSVASSANPQGPETNVTFTADVSAVNGTAAPTGSVSFILNGIVAATVPLDGTGRASYSTSSLPPGVNAVTASYGGSSTNSSSTGTLTQVIVSSVATPVISQLSGPYTTGILVAISDRTTGAVIHYTIDGSLPTASSPTYTGPIEINTSLTLNAVAVLGASVSAPSTATFTVPTVGNVSFPSGFSGSDGAIVYNGSAGIDGSVLQLTHGLQNEAGSAFYAIPAAIQGFTTDFTFQIVNPAADGFTFTIQNTGPQALGGSQAGLGYVGIHHSVAIKFDLVNNAGEGSNSIGIFTAGNLPTVPSIDMTGTGINLHSGDHISAHMTYDGVLLAVTLTDMVTHATWSHSFTIDIPTTVAASKTNPVAYVGFTGSTGVQTSTATITSWTFTAGIPQVPNYADGFDSQQLALNGFAVLAGNNLQLTDNGQNQYSSAFFVSPVDIRTFQTNFTFQILDPVADGFTFLIQNYLPYGPQAHGGYGAGLGYVGIHHSVAIKFDLLNNAGEGPNSTGIFTAGNLPTVPSVDLTGTGIDLHSGHTFNAQITYDGVNLALKLTDSVTAATWSHSFPIDIPAETGAAVAYVGFTGSTGEGTATQYIRSWIWAPVTGRRTGALDLLSSW